MGCGSEGKGFVVLQIKVGVQLASLKLPFKKALLTAAKMGAEAVEIDGRNDVRADELTRTGVRQLRKMTNDLNLQVSAVSFHTRRGYSTSDDLDRRIEATKQALQLTYDLGARVLVNHIGRVPAEGDTAGWNTLMEALTDLGRHGQRVGAMLAAETAADSGADLARVIAALPPATLGIDFNPALLLINGQSPSEAIQALAPHVLHVHATDGTRDLAQGRGFEVPLGRGSVDWMEILSRLEEQQYRGYFTLERRHSDDPIFEVGEAVKYLKSL
jgi:sugar phosphate isomerase/epimerase